MFKGIATGGTVASAPETTEIGRALATLYHPTDHIELRVLPGGRSIVRRADDLIDLIGFVSRQDDYSGVYYTLNPVRWDLDGSAKNADIVRRQWLLVDVDAVREPDTNATQQEHDAAQLLANRIIGDLLCEGWPLPLEIDSGNGWHLLYRIDLPNDELSKALCRDALKALAARFDSDTAKVDKSVHNASRIAKLPGTWARKAVDTPDRPQRLCRIVNDVGGKIVVTAEQLQKLGAVKAAPPSPPPTPTPGPTEPPTPFRGRVTNDATKISRARAYLKKIPGAISGQHGHTATFVAALKVVRGFDLTNEEAKTVLSEWNQTCQPPWSDKDLERKISEAQNAEGTRGNLFNAERNGKHEASAEKVIPASEWEVTINGDPCTVTLEDDAKIEAKRRARVEIYTIPELMRMEMPAVNWVIPGVLSEGLNILGGKPKQGKSMLALNIAMTVAAGGNALGNIRTIPGDVLYISLEDKQRRVHFRAGKMLKGIGCESSSRLAVAVTWPKQNEGGLKMIRWWFKRVQHPTLVIIDVWGRFRPPGNLRGNQYEQDYEAMGEVKGLVDELGCSALVLHHCRKGNKGEVSDVLEELSGTMGLSGAADGIMVLSRTRNDKEAKIFVTGRDVEDAELALLFDSETLTWKSLGPAEEHVEGKLQKLIITYLRSINGSSAFSTDIAAAIDQNPASVKATLYKLANKKLIRKVGNAWSYPAEEPPDNIDW